MSERLLALHQDTNASAALFLDGELVFAAAEERFSRVKYAGGRPAQTLSAIEQRYGVSAADEAVAIGGQCHLLPLLPLLLPLPLVPRPLRPRGEHDFFGPTYKAYLRFHEGLSANPAMRTLSEAANRALLGRAFPALRHLSDHHTAHAYSAYLTSGFEEAVAITADGFGDGASAKVFRCRAGRCEELYGSSACNSPGIYYSEIATLLGIDGRLAGKMTGLAAHGDPAVAYGLVARLLSLSPDKRSFVAPPLLLRRKDKEPYATLRLMKKADVAAAAQKRLEDVLLGFVERALDETGDTSIVLAGGVFGNVRLNQLIAELPRVRRLFVHPAMNDQGIAVGAGLEHLALRGRVRPARLGNVYLGPDYSDEDCARALDGAGLRYREEPDIEATVASLLVSGKVVARFAGRMEYGLRSLGNRSILYRSDDPSVNDWLNRMLRRTEYMPFAPATLAEHAAACYGDLSRSEDCVRFMTITCSCTDFMRRVSPGAVHVDGTARPQVVREEDNPRYHRLLRLVHEMTGSPSVLNTSFNMHEEPIVCSPVDACRALLDAGLPYLAMNRFLALGPGAQFPPA